MHLVDSISPTSRWLKLGLSVSGLVAGGAFGLVLTRFGKIVAGAPPATLGNYAWNAAVFGTLAAIVSPIVSWSALRRAPLWRTVTEPLGYTLVGATAAVIIGWGPLLLALPPLGLVLGFVHLQRRYPDEPVPPSGPA